MDVIRYYTRTGNTEKMAQLLGKALEIEPYKIDDPLPDEHIDHLFLGGGVYNMSPDKELRDYADSLDPTKVSEVVLFGTGGSVFTIEKSISKILNAKKIPIAKEKLFLHGMIPKMGNISDKQKEEISQFAGQFKEISTTN